MIQYITVFGGTCDVLSVFWQFTGEICFIKVPREWLKQSPVVFVLSLWSDQRVSVKLSSGALAEECRHSREWTNRTPTERRTACSWWRAFLDQNCTSSLTRFLCWFCVTIRSDQLKAWQMKRCLEWRSARFPWNTEQQSLRNPFFNQESRRSLSVLLGRERRFVRWILGDCVLNPRRRSFTRAPAHFCASWIVKTALQLRRIQCPAKL